MRRRSATDSQRCHRPIPRYARRSTADAQRLGWPALHARLAALDPETAARLAPNDAQRIQRALEVIEVSGQPMSHSSLGPRLIGRVLTSRR